jgi:methyl-accepting chemotaxis protein
MDSVLSLQNDKIIQLFNENFTSDDEKLFVENFKYYLQYGEDDTKFIINLDDLYKWIEFSRYDSAKRFLINKFEENKDYIITTLLHTKVEQRNIEVNFNHPICNHNKEFIYLNVKTFKKFCLKASTKKADIIHDYYLKMESILNKYIKDTYIQSNIKFIEDKEFERHKTLIYAYKNQPLIYLMKIKQNEDGSFILKIGHTKSIQDRVQKISSLFKLNVMVMDVYPCKKNAEFENMLHNHQYLLSMKYTDIINNNEKSIECYLIQNNDIYDKILRICNLEKTKYYADTFEEKTLYIREKELEIEERKLNMFENNRELFKKYENFTDYIYNLEKLMVIPNTIEKISEKLEDLSNKLEIISSKYDVMSNKYDIMSNKIDTILNNMTTKKQVKKETKEVEKKPEEVNHTITDTKEKVKNDSCKQGFVVQAYNPNDLSKVMHVFDNIMEATRSIENASFTPIKVSVKSKTIYKGFRWFFINRTEKDYWKVFDIGETVQIQEKMKDFVAAIYNNEIETVYENQTVACKDLGITKSWICNVLKYGTTLSTGKKLLFWSNISEEVKNKYLENNPYPQRTYAAHGKRIQKLDKDSGRVLEEIFSIAELSRRHKITKKTIDKYSNSGEVYNGFRWRYFGQD